MRLGMRLVLAVCVVLFTLPSWCQSPITIPTRGDLTWTFSEPNDVGQAAPSGYEGRTDSSSQTAIGKESTPNAGKRVVSHFTLSNQVQTCPDADGKVEGTGLFNFFVDYTDAQPTYTNNLHIELNVKAKYKGQVGDSGRLEGPVTADVDYNYMQTGRFRQNNSPAFTNTAPTNIQQHITLPIGVSPNAMEPPKIGEVLGGDPTAGQYAQAYGTGYMLSYWAGIYYSIAQLKWYGGQGKCVDVDFDPPSYSVQPPLGTEVKVKATVRTNTGERVSAKFSGAKIYSEVDNNTNGGFVDPSGGYSDAGGLPMEFIYTAPNHKMKDPGFGVAVISRAGSAIGHWHSGLGSGWGGTISCSSTHTGDSGGSEAGSWSNSEVARYTITVKDGVGSGSGFHQIKNYRYSKRPVANYADPRHPNWADDGSQVTEGTASEESKATVEVTLDKAHRTYSISIGTTPAPPTAKLHSSTCIPNHGCTESDQPFGASGCFQGIGGNFTDPNQLHGEVDDEKDGLGTAHTGKYIYQMRWDLGRQGTTQK